MTSSLTTCLKKAGDALPTGDRAAVLSRARELRGQGLDTHAAAVQAVQDRLDAVNEELKPLSQATFKKAEAKDAPTETEQPAAETAAARASGTAQRRGDERMPSGLSMNEARDRIRAMRGSSVAEVQKIVDAMTAGWKGGPQIDVVQTAADLPGEDNPSDVRGLYQGGRIWVVAGAHRNGATLRRAVMRTVAHEAVAHYGLRDMLGRDGWAQLMKNIQLGVKSGNRELRRIRDFVRETYVDADGTFMLSPTQEADEIAAKAVEEGIDADGNFKPGFGFLKSVWAKVAQFLRDLGLTVQFTNVELQGMLALSMRNLEAGQRTAGGGQLAVAAAREDGPMHHRAFHGTPHDFERFTTEKIGTGEGAQAFGWGLYFAESKGVAENYQRQLSGPQFDYWFGGKKVDGLAGRTPESPEQYAAWKITHHGSPEAALKALESQLPTGIPEVDAGAALIRRTIDEPGFMRREQTVRGNLFEVHIPDEVVVRMLLWDKPLSEQPQAVQDALAKGWPDHYSPESDDYDAAERGEMIYQRIAQMMAGRREDADTAGTPRGWGGFVQTMNDKVLDQAAASRRLDDLGVSGIRYLDGASRNRPLRQIKREFLAELPEDADFNEVLDLIGTGTFSPKNEAILQALVADDWLGFDYPSQALSAALSPDLANYDASPALQKAVADAQVDATHNLVVFNEKNVEVTQKNGEPVTKKERDDFLDGAHARAVPAGAQEEEATEPVRPEVSPWRDATGRMQFAPGAWLYEKLGAAAAPLLSKLQLKAASPELRRALRQMRIDVMHAQETVAEVAGEAMKLSADERAMVSDLIEQELAAGVAPPEHAVRLAAMINTSMGAQTDELVRLGMLTSESAEMWRGKYLPRFYQSKLGKQVADAWADAVGGMFGRTKAMAGVKGKHLRGRGLYETIPEAELETWKTMGWEVRDPNYQPGLTGDATVQVWRDFSRQERDSMGEIRDAGFRFVMGYMQTQRDIALGRMFEALAGNPEMSVKRETEAFSVQVPDGTVPGTGAKRYGKLAGRWVSRDTMSHLSQIEEAQSEAWRMYRKALALWKEGKTALNPVSHANNVLSNITMAHFAGIGYLRADKYIAAARDFATSAEGIKEAKDAGLFLGTMSDAELLNVLPEDLRALVKQQDSGAAKIGRSAFNVMTFFLRRPMGWAYQAEDTFFRYLIYKDARAHGMEPADSVDYAQRYIFAYDDLPKGARMVRDFAIPFFSYTYKAAPALLHTALTHPLRMAMPAAVLWAANAAAYAIASGDDDDSWDEKLRKYLTDSAYRNQVRQKERLEREHLPPWLKGTTALLTPKTVRLGTDELTKLPVFLDMSRMIPGGDLFDVSPNAGGIPLPQPITPSNPLFTTAMAMLGNKDLFFGKDLVDKNDTRGEATEKRLGWLWRQISPAVAFGNYHWERGMNALAQASGGEVKWLPEPLREKYTGIGNDGNPVQLKYAAAQTFGIKARPIDIEVAEKIDQSERRKMLRDIDTEITKLQRLNAKGAVSDAVMDKERAKAQVKKDRIREGLTVDGDDKN